MDKARYSLENLGNDVFELYEYGVLLLKFSCDSFRSDCEQYANLTFRSSNWIGSILRLFQKKFPSPFPVCKRNDNERLVIKYGEDFLIEYLRSKGFRVVKRIDESDKELIEASELRGYLIEGLVNGC